MELSERERRLLEEMESHLIADDPRFALSLRVRRLRAGSRVGLAVAGLVLGVTLMAVGVWRAHAAGIAIALVGYALILAGTVATVSALPGRRPGRLRVPWSAKGERSSS